MAIASLKVKLTQQTSTSTGPCWFTLINAYQVIEEEKLCENAEKMGKVLFSELSSLDPNIVPVVRGKGLLGCLVVRPQGSKM